MSAPDLEVQTAPARSARWWSSVPRHLGRARTSTIVLALLWAAIFVLYLAVRPDPAVTGASTTGPNGGVQPAPTATAPRTTAHPTTTPPTTTPAHTTPSGSATTSLHTTSPTDTGTASTTPTTTPAGPTLPTGGGSPSP